MRISDWSSDVCSSDLDYVHLTSTLTMSKQYSAPNAMLEVNVPAKLQREVTNCIDQVARAIEPQRAVSHEQAVKSTKPDFTRKCARSEERRVGKECVSTCRSRGAR